MEVGWVNDSDKSRSGAQPPPLLLAAARATTRIDDLLADPKLDAVVLATLIFTHFYLPRGRLAPVSTCSSRSRRPRLRPRPINLRGWPRWKISPACGHVHLYSPPVRAVKELLDKEALGRSISFPRAVSTSGCIRATSAWSGTLDHHDFSILLYWFEEMPTTIRVLAGTWVVKGITDVAFVTMDFPFRHPSRTSN